MDPLPERSSLHGYLVAWRWGGRLNCWPGACARLVGWTTVWLPTQRWSSPSTGWADLELAGWRVEQCGTVGCWNADRQTGTPCHGGSRSERRRVVGSGPLLQLASKVAGELVGAEQVYNCLWSHAGGVRVHIHYVVQPVTAADMERFGGYGPTLQVAMFAVGELPEPAEVEAIAWRARQLFASRV